MHLFIKFYLNDDKIFKEKIKFKFKAENRMKMELNTEHIVKEVTYACSLPS